MGNCISGRENRDEKKTQPNKCSAKQDQKAQVYRIQQSLLIHGGKFQEPQSVPETTDSTKTYIYYVFSYYTYL